PSRQDQPPCRTRSDTVRIRTARRPLSHPAKTLTGVQSTLALEVFTALPHADISRAMNSRVSSGLTDTVSAPKPASLFWIAGRFTTSRVTALSLSMTGLGVPAGAIKTIHA